MRITLLLAVPLAALAILPASAQAAAPVNVELTNFKFTPNAITLDHGQAYILRLHNAASGGHSFAAREFFGAASIAPEDRGLVTEGEVDVPAGQTREIHLTAPAAGSYKLKCTHAFHKAFGMSGNIIVR